MPDNDQQTEPESKFRWTYGQSTYPMLGVAPNDDGRVTISVHTDYGHQTVFLRPSQAEVFAEALLAAVRDVREATT